MLAPLVTQRHRDADHAGALRAQLARHLVGAEAVLGRDVGDALAGGFVDQRTVGERARDGAGVDAGQAGDVLQGPDGALGRAAHARRHKRAASRHKEQNRRRVIVDPASTATAA